ncbi:STAS-like domain-containing protein [Erythrobacter sp. THAF29]|uniref:STAS-like domain-containing protein n=1 Tax=Erythrobacter sp. THAF29 TaxID=2587851 RepID=UPI00351BB3DF
MFSIAEDFSRFPGPRFHWQGPNSGETFRGRLVKLLKGTDGRIKIILDGTTGIGSSFLDEAFGGLIRKEGFARDVVRRRFQFVSKTDPSYIVTIRNSIERASAESTDAA